MNEYDVFLVVITVVGFVISVGTVGVRFTKAVSQVKAATEALRDAVGELRRITEEIKNENRSDHREFEKRLGKTENRLSVLETELKERSRLK